MAERGHATKQSEQPHNRIFYQLVIVFFSGILLFSAGSKLFGFTNSVLEVKHLTRFILSLPETIYPVLAACLITIEFLLGLALLFKRKITLVLPASLMLSVLFLGINLFRMLFDADENCGCFGEVLSITTYYSFILDVIMVLGFAWLINQTNTIKKISKGM